MSPLSRLSIVRGPAAMSLALCLLAEPSASVAGDGVEPPPSSDPAVARSETPEDALPLELALLLSAAACFVAHRRGLL